jgi:oligoribonuclease NrnB/cAMP/cGMP phosphodiesterase (DHH superfamily)
MRYNGDMEKRPRTLIFYHGDCPDGFGGAYAAWKKFGNAAEYVEVKYGKEPVVEVKGAQVYFIDSCYQKEIMDKLATEAASLTALDHHEGTKDIVESMPQHVYDAGRSGASIAWSYFHPDTPLPELLTYVEDDDLYRFKLPDTRAILTYLTAHPFTFAFWDSVADSLSGEHGRREILSVARVYAEYFELLADRAAEHAKLVLFEGHEVYFATSHPSKPMKSLVGNLLAKKKGPFALVVSAHQEGFGVSIRGDGSVDVAVIARKYGGNGHPNSAGFAIAFGAPLPWKRVEDESITD